MNVRDRTEGSPKAGESAPDDVAAPATAAEVLRFDGFEFDVRRGELRRSNGSVVPLRPKTESLLRRLLIEPGRLLTKDELIGALWPATVVTDDSLVQCIGELRQALGDDRQRLIRTLHRRGYRLECAVTRLDRRSEQELGILRSDHRPGIEASPGESEVATRTDQDPLVDTVATTGGLGVSRRGTPSSNRKWATIVLSLTAIALALGGGLWLLQRLQAKPGRIDDTIAARATYAIVPFETDAGDPALRYLADDVVDAIATQFATRIGMRGIGRAATAPLAADGKSPVQVATALNATGAVTGRVTHAKEAGAAIDVHLEMASNGTVVWSEHFEPGNPPSPDAIQTIGLHVVNAVRGLTSRRDLIRSEATDASADPAELTLRGWNDLDRRASLEDLHRAQRRFERALQSDPDSLIALNGYSASFGIQLAEPGAPLTKDELARYERAVDRVIRLAPEDATANLLWASMQIRLGRPDLALPALDKVLRLAPSYPNVHILRADALLRLGRPTEVPAEADRGLALSNFDYRRASTANAIAAEAAIALEEDELAFELAQRAVVQYPGNIRARAVLVAAEALSGRDPSASLAELRQRWPAVTVAGLADWSCESSPYVTPQLRYYDGLRRAHLLER